MKSFITKLIYSLLATVTISFPSLSLADDTDIYVASGASANSEPMVMFVIDWRPNLTSTICNGFGAGDTNAQIATQCGWSDAAFVSNFTASDKSDGTITFFELLRASLKEVMSSIDGVKIGLMINHDDNCTGNPTAGPTKTGCSNGAYVMSGFKSIDATDANGNKAAFHAKLAAIPNPIGAQSHKYQGKELYFELFRYLTGQGIYNGHLGYKDYGDNTAAGNLDTDFPTLVWDASIESGANYVTPIASDAECLKIFVVNFLFQVTQQESDSDSAITANKASGGMNNLVLTGVTNKFETVLSFMQNNDLADGTYGTAPNVPGKQNVTSYFLVDSPNTSTNSYANAGGTGSAIALGTDPETMVSKLRNVFNQILSVSTTFVAASVPVNVFNRTEYLDDVYIALFEAEENGKPRWIGNLKKLKLQKDATNTWFIGDVNGTVAFAADGRIAYDALTFWTNPAGADVVAANVSEGEISGYDGRSVNRGGTGQKINGLLSGTPGINNTDIGARQLFTEPATYTNGTPAALLALDATATNASNLWSYLNANSVYSSGTTLNFTSWSAAASYATASVADQAEALKILKFARGIDVNDEDNDTSTTDTRPWLLGDPIHSRPLAVNYGATGGGYNTTNPDIRILMGGNDGFMHMFRNTTAGGAQSGTEDWAFMPNYVLGMQKRMMDNDPGTPLHPYGIDGEAVVYAYDANKNGTLLASENDKVYVYFGLRRGGRHYYALDITTPDSPKMLWHISNSSTGFSELGLTFSTPRIINVSYDTYIKKKALLFAGGYDTNKDTRSTSVGSSDTIGRAVFIVDAETGALIWKGMYGLSTGVVSATEYHNNQMADSIPAAVTPLDSDGNGVIDRLYVGDTGGRIWRVDMASLDRTNWKITKFASVGRHANSNKSNDRRIFHAVDIVQTSDAVGRFDAVIVGTGDRPNPLDKSIGSNIPENWFYMIKDRFVTSGTPPDGTSDLIVHNELADLSNNCFQQVSVTCTQAQIDDLADYGWKMKLEQEEGEKMLSAPITIAGNIFFTTYLPPDTNGGTTCGPSEGSGLLYAVKLQDASAAFNFNLSNSAINANGEVIELQIEDRFRYTGSGIPADPIGIVKDGKIIVVPPGGNLLPADSVNQKRVFWYHHKQ